MRKLALIVSAAMAVPALSAQALSQTAGKPEADPCQAFIYTGTDGAAGKGRAESFGSYANLCGAADLARIQAIYIPWVCSGWWREASAWARARSSPQVWPV